MYRKTSLCDNNILLTLSKDKTIKFIDRNTKLLNINYKILIDTDVSRYNIIYINEIFIDELGICFRSR